jgi:hypothetical protein
MALAYTPPILAKEIPKLVKNWSELTPQQQMKRAWELIAKDFYFYSEKNLYITNKKGELVKLRPNIAQRALIDAIIDDLKHGRPVRYIVLKARQLGLSTIIEALCYWWAATHKWVSAAIVAHEREASENIYQMFQKYYANSDPAFKPATKYYTKHDLTFDNEKGTGIKSQIRTAVAKDGGTGRSQTNRFVHCSEVAFWKGGADIVSSLLQTVPLLPETFIFLESTANGMGGYFYDTWMKAKKGESIFKPFFFPWHAHDEYELNIPTGKWKSTPEEKELIAYFKELKYPDKTWKRKLQWRREKMKEFVHDPEKFYQEYPSTDIEAFIASGRPVFSTKALIKMQQRAEDKSFAMYDLTGTPTTVTAEKLDYESRLIHKMQGLRVWELPQEGHKYVIGADVAEGIEVTGDNGKEGDSSVATVMDRETRKTVARYRAHIDPDAFGDFLFLLGKWYQNAVIGVEVNNQGIATIQRLRDKLYRHLYMREHGYDELFEEPTAKMGWRTDKASKYVMVTDLVKAIRDGSIVDYDMNFITECVTYVRDESGRTNAQEGFHDDCVMSTAIALQLFTWKEIDRDPPKPLNRTRENLARQGELPRLANELKERPATPSFHGVVKRLTKIKNR